jgi:hypothetical protein
VKEQVTDSDTEKSERDEQRPIDAVEVGRAVKHAVTNYIERKDGKKERLKVIDLSGAPLMNFSDKIRNPQMNSDMSL